MDIDLSKEEIEELINDLDSHYLGQSEDTKKDFYAGAWVGVSSVILLHEFEGNSFATSVEAVLGALKDRFDPKEEL